MRVILRTSWLSALLLVFIAGNVWGQSLSKQQIKQIKETKFTTLEGEEVTVNNFEGKMVMLDFWETWCSPCLQSFPGMQKALDEYPDHFVVLAINSGFADTEKDMRNFIEKNDYSFNFLMDSNELLNKKLGIRSIPFKVFIGPEGNFIQSKLGKWPNEYRHIKKLLTKHTDVQDDSQ